MGAWSRILLSGTVMNSEEIPVIFHPTISIPVLFFFFASSILQSDFEIICMLFLLTCHGKYCTKHEWLRNGARKTHTRTHIHTYTQRTHAHTYTHTLNAHTHTQTHTISLSSCLETTKSFLQVLHGRKNHGDEHNCDLSHRLRPACEASFCSVVGG